MGGSSGQAARSAQHDSAHIYKLESEITDIKHMLNDYGMRNADRRDKISSILDGDDGDENINNDNNQSMEFIKD